MGKLKDQFWIWGQAVDSHYNTLNNHYKLPGSSKMTSLEGAYYLGVKNCCRVVIHDDPKPPFNQDNMALVSMREVVWSVLGAAGSNSKGIDVEEVLRQAAIFPNIRGGVLDDFFSEHGSVPRLSVKEVNDIHKQLNKNTPPLDLWIVVYDYQLDSPVGEYLNECDVITYWTWRGSELVHLDKNFEKLKKMTPGKRRLAGCYMWNYGESRPLTVRDMEFQCGKYLNWMEKGDIEGIIFCSNCIADLGLDTVEWTRNWIAENGEAVYDW
ncbi:MAG: hypothetical protein A4E71_00143 [Smithella sp. PtaU1.Bin162]|nr:MAG: hypothetical protein A4E71_00143 [Smithella sp. PtaU1.Bin162]